MKEACSTVTMLPAPASKTRFPSSLNKPNLSSPAPANNTRLNRSYRRSPPPPLRPRVRRLTEGKTEGKYLRHRPEILTIALHLLRFLDNPWQNEETAIARCWNVSVEGMRDSAALEARIMTGGCGQAPGGIRVDDLPHIAASAFVFPCTHAQNMHIVRVSICWVNCLVWGVTVQWH